MEGNSIALGSCSTLSDDIVNKIRSEIGMADGLITALAISMTSNGLVASRQIHRP